MKSFWFKLQTFAKNYQYPFLIYISYILGVFLTLYVLYLFKVVPYVENFNQYLYFLTDFGDGSIYKRIALKGYIFPLFAFYPGYPIFLKILSSVLPFYLATYFNVILLLFTIFSLYKFLDLFDVNLKDRNKVLVLFLAYPTALFLVSNYTENLYILLSAWCLYFLIKKSYFWFFLFGALLSFIKITALALPLVYLVHLLFLKKLNFKFNYESFKNWLKYGISLVTLTLGTSIYFGMLHFEYGRIDLFFESQKESYWDRDVLNFKLSKSFVIPETYFVRISELIIFIFLAGLLIYYQKKLQIELLTFSLLHFLIPISSGTLMSINRLSLLCFPLLFIFFIDVVKSKRYFYLLLMIFLLWQFLGFLGIYRFYFIG